MKFKFLNLTVSECLSAVQLHAQLQGDRAMNADGVCAYRGGGGTKCFIGALIDDDEYTENMEGQSVYGLINCNNHILNELQRIHDRACPTNWDPLLLDLRIKYDSKMDRKIGELADEWE